MQVDDSMLVIKTKGNMGDWQLRHRAAILYPRNVEIPIVTMLNGWITYAKQHKARFDSTIGEDGFLSEPWESIGDALRDMLNGSTGRLDCGTLDGLILDTMLENGINTYDK